jgi:ferredoxin
LLYYFSGTGNARRLTEVAATRFEEAEYKVKVRNIEDGGLDEEHDAYSRHGFLFPVHGFGIPPIVTRFMATLSHQPGKEAFFVVSMGNEEYKIPPSEGKCMSQGKSILEKRGYKVVGADAVSMPNNWIAAFSAPTSEKAAVIIETGEQAVREFTEKMINGEEYIKESHWLSKLVGLIYPWYLRGMKYMSALWRLDDGCNFCGICVQICPVGNIRMVNDTPEWGQACEYCFRCINLCPKESIQCTLMGRTEGRRRYKEPHLKVKDLIRERQTAEPFRRIGIEMGNPASKPGGSS